MHFVLQVLLSWVLGTGSLLVEADHIRMRGCLQVTITVSCNRLSPEPCYVTPESSNICLHSYLEVGGHIVQLSW